MAAGAGAAAAAAAAARRKKIKSSGAFGTVVTVAPEEFARAIAMEPEPLVVVAAVKAFWSEEVKKYRYLAAVKGLNFFTESTGGIALPEGAITIESDKITVPADL